jgi:hypothetical protein
MSGNDRLGNIRSGYVRICQNGSGYVFSVQVTLSQVR